LDSRDATKLHIVAINKMATAQSTRFSLPGGSFSSGTVYGFDEASNGTITSRGAVTGIASNEFTYSLPPRSVLHFVLNGSPIQVNVRLAPPLAPRDRDATRTLVSGGLPAGREGATRVLSLDGRTRTLLP